MTTEKDKACPTCGKAENEFCSNSFHLSNDKTAEEIPVWYTYSEMYDRLIRENYSKEIAKEISHKWANDLQGAFSKGYEKAQRRSVQQIKEYREKLKEATELNKEAIALLDVIRMDMVDAGGNAWVVPQIEAIIKKLYPDYFDQTDSTK